MSCNKSSFNCASCFSNHSFVGVLPSFIPPSRCFLSFLLVMGASVRGQLLPKGKTALVNIFVYKNIQRGIIIKNTSHADGQALCLMDIFHALIRRHLRRLCHYSRIGLRTFLVYCLLVAIEQLRRMGFPYSLLC